jgi:hypothetical protein
MGDQMQELYYCATAEAIQLVERSLSRGGDLGETVAYTAAARLADHWVSAFPGQDPLRRAAMVAEDVNLVIDWLQVFKRDLLSLFDQQAAQKRYLEQVNDRMPTAVTPSEYAFIAAAYKNGHPAETCAIDLQRLRSWVREGRLTV